MYQLPEQHAQAGQLAPGTQAEAAREQARYIMNAVDEVLAEQATFHRDDSPVPVIGTAPPVAQPGRAPMSQGATDASVLMLAGGATTSMVGLTAAVLMYVSQYADPVVCALVFGAPTVLVLAVARLVGRAKDAVPAEQHHHYNGPVYQDQRNVKSKTTGVVVKNTNL